MTAISIRVRSALVLLVTLVAACSNDISGTEQIIGHTDVSFDGVTYKWPYDGSEDVGNPADWKHSAFMPNRIWNETIGAATSIKLLPDNGYSAIHLGPAKPKHWDIQLDGSGLPLDQGEQFRKEEDHRSFVIGKVTGPGIVSPGTVVICQGERSAYANCRAPGGPLPNGFCAVLLNDRGVQHTLPFTWGKWLEARAMLKQYRALVGIPDEN